LSAPASNQATPKIKVGHRGWKQASAQLTGPNRRVGTNDSYMQ